MDTDQDENTSTPESCAEATLNTQDCLRALSVAEILLAQGSVWSFPTTGTSTLPKSFAEQLTSGDFNKVPVMIGGNLDEGKLFVALNEFAGNDPITDMNTYANTAANPVYLATGGSLVPGVFAGYVQAATAEYASHNYAGDAEDFFSLALAGIWTDGVFACHNKNMISELSEHVNTYAYEFTDVLAPNVYTMAAIATGNNNLLASIPLGAAHSFELQYLFQPISRMQVMGGTEEQVALSENMVDYFAQFAKTGNPNSLDNSLESWSTFADSSAYQSLNTNMGTISSAEFSAAHNPSVSG